MVKRVDTTPLFPPSLMAIDPLAWCLRLALVPLSLMHFYWLILAWFFFSGLNVNTLSKVALGQGIFALLFLSFPAFYSWICWYSMIITKPLRLLCLALVFAYVLVCQMSLNCCSYCCCSHFYSKSLYRYFPIFQTPYLFRRRVCHKDCDQLGLIFSL